MFSSSVSGGVDVDGARIMVSQSVLLLGGGLASNDERVVESKPLERLRSAIANCRGGGDGLFLECGGNDSCG